MFDLRPPVQAVFRRAARILCAAALPLVPLSAASAGDMAEVQVLGFSPNGAFFAFEQYGIQDGSGFPYSDIFVIDVIGDSWVPPSPFRLRDDTEDDQVSSNLSAARADNRAAAQPLLQQKDIAGGGQTVGFNPRTELNSDPFRMLVAARDFGISNADPIDLSLTEAPLASAKCQGYGIEDTKGFRLTMVHKGVTRVLADDTSLPASRGCALGYRIERMITFFPEQAPPVFAILVQMSSYGFEGPDYRYLAITGRL